LGRRRAGGDDGEVVTEAELLRAVDRAFETTGRATPGWPDPHPDRKVQDEEYSRVTNGAKWRILGARVDAWFAALSDAGLADIERDADVRWLDDPLPGSAIDRAVPRAAGAIPLVVGRAAIADVEDAGLRIAVGDPAKALISIPDCGCDACDSGSVNELEHLDDHLISVVTGRLRRLWRDGGDITSLGTDGRWSSSWRGATQASVPAVLADPKGWHELSGASWL
jgi:hypothetical protein